VRILLLNQFFWPDSAATSQFLTDLARGLAERGHDVYAISAEGGGYAPGDLADPPDVKIHRVRTTRFVRGPLGRVLSYGSYFLSCLMRGMTTVRPDVVITLTTPPLLSLIGNILKAFRGARHFIWEMDVYPDVAVDLNYFKAGGMLDRLTGALADFSRHRADGILALGTCMKERLVARGIPEHKIQVAENWADSELIQPNELSGGPLTLLYSGNLGLAHDTETILDAMRALKESPEFSFVFAGGGPLRKSLIDCCSAEKIENAQFRPYSSKTSLGESLGLGHIGLVTQRAECVGSVVPSKVYGLLAAGRPVLYIGPRTSTAARLIYKHSCGWQVDCGDSAALISLLYSLAADRTEVAAAGQRAREALLQFYDLPIGVNRICQLIGANGHRVRLAEEVGAATLP
jgi:colanic acid biosynthesis glycosyl transferase WcaI